MWRNRLFWQFFLSMLAVVLCSVIASVAIENRVRDNQSPARIDASVAELIDFRDTLAALLYQEDLDSASDWLRSSTKNKRQFLVFDAFDNEILGRDKLHQDAFNKHFSHPLSDEFRQRGLPLQTTITSLLGQTYFIQIRPKILFSPWLSPRFAGSLLRLVLLIGLSAIACYVLTRALTRRIRLLKRATHQLANNRFASDIPLAQLGRDELGQLGQDFHHLAEKLQHSERARKQMLSDISHELRSPLARLQVAIEIARTRQANGDDTNPQLARMETESQRMNTLIGQIIHIQQLSLESPETALQNIELSALLQDIIDNVNFEYQQRHKCAVLTTKPQAINIAGDSDLLYSAFENVLRNAMSHTHEHTQVDVSLTQKNRELVITIRDKGDGIADDDADRIFQPFVRLDSSRNRGTGGNGLGLAIAKAIVERHNGSIQASNCQSSHGLQVSIMLPLTS